MLARARARQDVLDRLFGQGADHLRGEIRNFVRCTGHRAPEECEGVRDALRDVDEELGQESPDHVDELGALADEEITRPSRLSTLMTVS